MLTTKSKIRIYGLAEIVKDMSVAKELYKRFPTETRGESVKSIEELYTNIDQVDTAALKEYAIKCLYRRINYLEYVLMDAPQNTYARAEIDNLYEDLDKITD